MYRLVEQSHHGYTSKQDDAAQSTGGEGGHRAGHTMPDVVNTRHRRHSAPGIVGHGAAFVASDSHVVPLETKQSTLSTHNRGGRSFVTGAVIWDGEYLRSHDTICKIGGVKSASKVFLSSFFPLPTRVASGSRLPIRKLSSQTLPGPLPGFLFQQPSNIPVGTKAITSSSRHGA